MAIIAAEAPASLLFGLRPAGRCAAARPPGRQGEEGGDPHGPVLPM